MRKSASKKVGSEEGQKISLTGTRRGVRREVRLGVRRFGRKEEQKKGIRKVRKLRGKDGR